MIKVLSSSGILFGQGEMPTMVGASSESGFFFAAACSLLFNYVKTQIQKMQPDAEISTLALLTVLSKPSKQEDPSNFTPNSLSIVSGLLLVS